MQSDYRAGALTLALLAASTGLWINLLRQGFRSGWSWPLQPRRDVPWRPWEAVATILIVLICIGAVVQQFAAGGAPDGAPESTVFDIRKLQLFAGSQLAELALIPLILGIWCPCRWEDFGLRRHGWQTDLQFAIWGVLLAQLPVHLLEYPLQGWRAEDPHPMLELLKHSSNHWQTLPWIALEVVVLAPLVEELLFRVVLQGALEREIPAVWAIILTAAAFACIHQQADWLPLFPLALILGYIYYRRRSYIAVVVLHGLFNAISLLCALWITKIIP
ncbi:MAG: Abortive infection protein [Planctomycetaceae bacterium]|nr:Abortive infection protein [Planctomycetaceae bacterium]